MNLFSSFRILGKSFFQLTKLIWNPKNKIKVFFQLLTQNDPIHLLFVFLFPKHFFKNKALWPAESEKFFFYIKSSFFGGSWKGISYPSSKVIGFCASIDPIRYIYSVSDPESFLQCKLPLQSAEKSFFSMKNLFFGCLEIREAKFDIHHVRPIQSFTFWSRYTFSKNVVKSWSQENLTFQREVYSSTVSKFGKQNCRFLNLDRFHSMSSFNFSFQNSSSKIVYNLQTQEDLSFTWEFDFGFLSIINTERIQLFLLVSHLSHFFSERASVMIIRVGEFFLANEKLFFGCLENPWGKITGSSTLTDPLHFNFSSLLGNILYKLQSQKSLPTSKKFDPSARF